MSKKLPIVIFFFALFAFTIVYITKPFGILSSGTEYKTETVYKGNLKDEINISGELKAAQEATIGFLSAGRVEWIGFNEGEEVAKDQVIASFTESAVNKDKKQTRPQYASQTIIAPFNGIITQIKGINVGQNISPTSQSSVTVISKELMFVASVDETEINNLKVGQSGEIKLDAYPNKTFDGTITKIDSSATKLTTGGSVIEIEMSIDPSESKLFNGLNGEVTFNNTLKTDVLIIPRLAVRKEANSNYVFVLNQGKAVKKDITTGETIGNKTEVALGLQEGEKVILGDVK